ncbi:nuclear transport factor 2 family protein [Streptomyces sp. NPDC049597]|uniref:nuclear transport factor 2 family protein n=1 Tax=Streptomyces sp. NPDC049597 TaxID=3155276 RepID=UPI0034470CCF
MTAQRDHHDISTLVSRLFRALDAREFTDGWADGCFTSDVRTTTPVGDAEGADAVRHAEVAVGRFARTQHIACDVLVDVAGDGETATASWNALMVHVHHDSTLRERGEGANPLFTVGGVHEAELRRTSGGWRISRMDVRAVWTTGEPPVVTA